MRLKSFVTLGICVLTVGTGAQTNTPTPKISSEPLTAEQIEIYRAVVNDYIKETRNAALNVSNKTSPLDLTGPLFEKGCMQGIDLEKTANSVRVIHSLSSSAALSPKAVIVDPRRHVKQAYSNGLFSLSEIIFDKQHLHAFVSYSFACGVRCGNGRILILEKVGDTWKVSKTCGGWVS